MKKQNNRLRSARLERSWTPEFVSGKVGVSLNTYNRWEAGEQMPRLSSLDALCKVFEMSPEELGFTHLATAKKIRTAQDEEIAETLSVPPFISSIPDDDDLPSLSESIRLWGLGIESCWELYMNGGQAELERLLPTYLSNLSKPTLYPGSEQKAAAGLTAQVYQLLALLELQHGDFINAQANGTQALVYSQLAKDWNLYIASQLRLAAIFTARKRTGSALSAYNEALKRVNVSKESISPLLHSWIFAGLAEIQATMGRDVDALQLLQLAFAVFPAKPEEDPCFSYTRCDRSLLFLYEGLVFLRLGQTKLAWEAFSEIDELKPAPVERTRAEFLLHKTYTSVILGNMIQSCIYLEAAAKAAQAVQSDLAFSAVYSLYEHMLAHWGSETRVRSLSRLFQR
ncbi:MAG: helix-turn-helix transcriptional regulator [Chloroflexi bacterium]|nr:MAG: helix-turn-helix transcriptional regulator [Chloroflexota bacterium]